MPFVSAVCPTCSEVRYKSTKSIEAREDCVPANFEPVGDAPPVLTDGPPMCHTCDALLVFTESERLTPAKAEMARARTFIPEKNPIDTLFVVNAGENVKSVTESPSGILVITDKRILRINL